MPNPSKKKLTSGQAADQWAKAKKTIKLETAKLEEAADVLHAHFEKTGRTQLKLVRRTFPGARTVLDQAAVKVFLGKELRKYQKQTDPSPGLELIDPPKA